MSKKIILLLILPFCFCAALHAQQWAVKTNMLYWAGATPNVGVEVALSRHSTVSLTGNYNPWVIGQDGKIQHWFVQPAYRYWFCEKYTRSFIGIHAIAGKYEVGGFKLPFNLLPQFRNHYYKGWVAGAGVSYGYHFYLSPHWNLEATLGVGYLRTRYSRSDAPNHYVSRNYVGPTEVGISFVYLFNSKK